MLTGKTTEVLQARRCRAKLFNLHSKRLTEQTSVMHANFYLCGLTRRVRHMPEFTLRCSSAENCPRRPQSSRRVTGKHTVQRVNDLLVCARSPGPKYWHPVRWKSKPVLVTVMESGVSPTCVWACTTTFGGRLWCVAPVSMIHSSGTFGGCLFLGGAAAPTSTRLVVPASPRCATRRDARIVHTM